MFFNRTMRHDWHRPMTSRYNEFKQYGHNEMNMWSHENVRFATPEADVLELDEHYILQVALPGVVLDDVELKMEGNLLTILAKRTPAMFEERAHILNKELPCYLVREFEFEVEILHDQIEAKLDRGILFVSIPKMEVALRIPVSHGTLEGSFTGGMKTRVGKNETMRGQKEISLK